MRKKKRNAAKVRPPNKRVENRKFAFLVATFIRSAQRMLAIATAAEDSDEEREAMEYVKYYWCQAGEMINFGNSAMMHLVADELEGKLHSAKHDDAILKAHAKAMRTGKGLKVFPRISKVDNAGIILSGKSSWVTKRYLRDRLKILGCGTSPKSGADCKGR